MKLLDAVILCGTAAEKWEGERKRACGMDDARSFWIRHVCVYICMYVCTHTPPFPHMPWIEIYHSYR
jgi:hypothetical protein